MAPIRKIFTYHQKKYAIQQLHDNALTVREFKKHFSPGGIACVSYNYLAGSNTISDTAYLRMDQVLDWLNRRELNYDFFLLRRDC